MYISELAPTQVRLDPIFILSHFKMLTIVGFQLRGTLINAYSAWFVVGQLVAPVVLQQNNVATPYRFRKHRLGINYSTLLTF